MEETSTLNMKAIGPSTAGKFQPDNVVSSDSNILCTTILLCLRQLFWSFLYPGTELWRTERRNFESMQVELRRHQGIMASPVLMHLLTTACTSGKGSSIALLIANMAFLTFNDFYRMIQACRLIPHVVCVEVSLRIYHKQTISFTI
jgi:hypothetical protein